MEGHEKSKTRKTKRKEKEVVGKPSWHIMEACEVVGGANVSHITTFTPLELYPATAMIDPLEVT